MRVQVLRVAQQGTVVSVHYHPNSATGSGPAGFNAPASFSCEFDTAQVHTAWEGALHPCQTAHVVFSMLSTQSHKLF